MRHVILVGHDVSGSKKGERYITARSAIGSSYEQHHGIPNFLLQGSTRRQIANTEWMEITVNAQCDQCAFVYLACILYPCPAGVKLYTHKIASSDNGNLRLHCSLVVH